MLCGICGDSIEDGEAVQAECQHIFCRDCVINYQSSSLDTSMNEESVSLNDDTVDKTKCPVCKQPLTVDFDKEVVYEKIDDSSSLSNKVRNGIKLLTGSKKSILDKIDLNSFQSSTKCEALMMVKI